MPLEAVTRSSGQGEIIYGQGRRRGVGGRGGRGRGGRCGRGCSGRGGIEGGGGKFEERV